MSKINYTFSSGEKKNSFFLPSFFFYVKHVTIFNVAAKPIIISVID